MINQKKSEKKKRDLKKDAAHFIIRNCRLSQSDEQIILKRKVAPVSPIDVVLILVHGLGVGQEDTKCFS